MDITEAFESSHIMEYKKVEQILGKYYVKDVPQGSKRNSPFTFKNDGFYMTLNERIQPILKVFFHLIY